MGLLEGLAAADPALDVADEPAWARAASARSRPPTRKSELRVVEDQVDAVVCAYVALFAAAPPDAHHDLRRPRDRLHRHPDPARGPAARPARPRVGCDDPVRPRCGSTPPGTRRSSRPPRRSSRWSPRVLDDAGINYLSVTGRTKSVASFAEKAEPDGRRRAALSPTRCTQITDQIGVRVITYVHGDVAAVADLLDDQVVVHRRPRHGPGDRRARAASATPAGTC